MFNPDQITATEKKIYLYIMKSYQNIHLFSSVVIPILVSLEKNKLREIS